MKKLLLKIGCFLSVLFLFTSCVIDDTAYLVVKLNDEYNDNPVFNDCLDKSSKYNLKGRWYLITDYNLERCFEEHYYRFGDSESNPWEGIEKVIFPLNYIKSMDLEGEYRGYGPVAPKKVKLPSSVTEIWSEAFIRCSNLKK